MCADWLRQQTRGPRWTNAGRRSIAYRGPFLAGSSLDDAPEFDIWVQMQRAYWQDRFDLLCERLLNEFLNGGQPVQAVEVGQRWVALRDDHEPTYRLLATAHAAAGNVAEARAALAACQRALAALGLEVSAELRLVIATGMYQRPKIPAFSASLPAEIAQLPSGSYRRPEALAPGAVLVVGSGQSGCQIAEELYQSGRTVYLCVGHAGRMPRRYRGRDAWTWAYLMGTSDRNVTELQSPQERFEAHPHLSGKGGGHTINLHRFARDGVKLLGHLRGARDGRLSFAPDLRESLAAADKVEADFCDAVNRFVAKTGLDAPHEELPALTDGYAEAEQTELDLASANICTVIWAIGYTFDFGFVKVPVYDATGYPVHSAGITSVPGLYFVGLPWLRSRGSGLLFGVGKDAAWIATEISRRSHQHPRTDVLDADDAPVSVRSTTRALPNSF